MRLAINVSALGITLLTAVGCGPATPPSDASIIARFNAHRAEFGQLLEMFDYDRINGRLGCADSADDARGPQPISPQRRAEYVKIFNTIGCDGAVYYSPGSKANASFSMWSVGMLFAGQDKSIMLFPGEPPSPIVETTDGYRWTPDGSPTWRGRAVSPHRRAVVSGVRCELTSASRAPISFPESCRPPRSAGGRKPRFRRRTANAINLRIHRGVLNGLRTSMPGKCLSLSVTTTQSFTSATAATIISRSLLGFPTARPSDIRRAQTNAAFSSNDNILPLNSDCGPSGPANHASNRSRFFPLGLSSMPRRISATVREEMNKSPSDCTPIHSNSDWDGSGFVILLMTFVPRR